MPVLRCVDPGEELFSALGPENILYVDRLPVDLARIAE